MSAGELGLVYFVFLPALFTTPIAGRLAVRIGVRKAFWGAIAVTLIGVGLAAPTNFASILAGLSLIGAGLFFAQAAVTTFVGQAATADRAAASGLYLASYYFGGVVGSALLGVIFTQSGWVATLGLIAVSLVVAALMGIRLVVPSSAS